MTSSKKWAIRKVNHRADIGIGMMILFIAMILVSAAAASVLINTANQMREQAKSTGDEAIEGVSTEVQVLSKEGIVDNTHNELDQLILYVAPEAGSSPISLEELTIELSFNGVEYTFAYGTSLSDTIYTASQIRDVSGSEWTVGDHVMAPGDLIEIIISNTAGNLNMGPNENVEMRLILTEGTMNTLYFTTPSVFSSTYVDL